MVTNLNYNSSNLHMSSNPPPPRRPFFSSPVSPTPRQVEAELHKIHKDFIQFKERCFDVSNGTRGALSPARRGSRARATGILSLSLSLSRKQARKKRPKGLKKSGPRNDHRWLGPQAGPTEGAMDGAGSMGGGDVFLIEWPGIWRATARQFMLIGSY